MSALAALIGRNRLQSGVFAAGTGLLAVVGVVRDQWFVWIYLAALAASVVIVVALDRSRGPIPGSLIWMLVVWTLIHLAGGLLPNPTGRTEILYGMWIVDGALRYDQIVHGFGIAAATATFAYLARSSARPLFWGFFFAQAVGLVNETAENTFAFFVEGSNVGDMVNTMWDMAWHVIGATVATLWMMRYGIPGTKRVARDS